MLIPQCVRQSLRRHVFMPGIVRRTERVVDEIRSFAMPQADTMCARLLHEARTRVPYYREALAATPDGEELACFDTIPILTKSLVRENIDKLVADGVDESGFTWCSTGGSTGQPLDFRIDEIQRDWIRATDLWYFREMLGCDPDSESSVVLWSSPIDYARLQRARRKRLGLWLTDTTMLDCFVMDKATLQSHVRMINAKKPRLIKGYAGSLFQVARFARQHNLPVHRPTWLVSTAELLRPHMRGLIEEVFCCRVHDLYGCRETGPIAGQCAHGRSHVFAFHVRAEIVDENGAPTAVGEEGRLLITPLHNVVMPMIRYELGDRAAMGSGTCPCGSPLPVFEVMSGRVTDHFTLRDGTLVHGQTITHALFFQTWVKEFRAIQHEADFLELLYVSAQDAPEESIREIERKIRISMGSDCRIVWTRVDEIPKTPHGKHLFTQSRVTMPTTGEL